MTTRLLVFFLFTFTIVSLPQVITTSPLHPTVNDSIVVYLDATQPGAQAIHNYPGTLYAHTGVNTNLGDWQHVIGNWGDNQKQPSLTRLNTNYYKLTIGFPGKFYNVNSNEHINSLAFVFRTSDGSKQTSPDIFVPLYSTGLTVNFDEPQVSTHYGDPLRSPYFIKSTDSVHIKVSAVGLETKVSTLALFVNEKQVIQTSKDSLKYSFFGGDYQSKIIQVSAVGIDTAGNADTSSFDIVINPSKTKAQLPQNALLGINYNSSTSVTLALYAPYKSFVYVVGDFNDWKVDPNYFMKEDSIKSDSVVWWITINNLTPGKEYAYQYFVDGNLRIADPYSHKILDPSNDSFISDAVYPDLKAYPSGKTSEIVSVFQTDKAQYNWEVTNYKKPKIKNLVIYELLVRDFVSTHWYKTVEDTLNYLKRLGINAIELMPVMEFEGNISWGYNPDFHMALDKYYGTPEALKSLVDKAHSMGVAVILDIVLNHVMGSSPFARLYWDQANNRPASNNPWLNPIPKHDFNVGNDFNHESPETRYYVDRVTSYWINEYHIDGYRFDLSKGFTQKNTLGNVGAWGQYDQSRINILERMANKIWQIDSTSILILEHFADNNEEKVLSDFGFLSWGNMNYNYNQATMGYRKGPSGDDQSWNLSGAYFANRGWSKPSLVSYMESHDEERLMYKNEAYGNHGTDYNIKDTSTGLKRIAEASAFFFTIPGPKMIYEFGELGYDYSKFYDIKINAVPQPYGTDYAKTDPKPIRWDYLKNPDRLRLYKTMAALIKLRNNYPIFQRNATTIVADSLKTIQFADSSMKVNIIGNFGVYQSNMNPSFQQTGEWYDYLSGDSMNVSNQNTFISLAPGEYHIYTTVKLPTPDLTVPTDVKNNNDGLIKDYKLEQNYPNPFNPSTIIKYQIQKAGIVSIKIYDILGREIKTLVNKYQQSGNYEIQFNAAGLASGVYFYQLRADDFISTKKMILLR